MCITPDNYSTTRTHTINKTAPDNFKNTHYQIKTAPGNLKNTHYQIKTAPDNFKNTHYQIKTAPDNFKNTHYQIKREPVDNWFRITMTNLIFVLRSLSHQWPRRCSH